MKKGKIIAITLAAAIAVTGVGFAVFNRDREIDFGEIVIDGIPEKSADAKRIMSFNVRCVDDKEGSVTNRSKIVTAIIDQYLPDSFGVQEATGQWMKILNEALGEKYACIGEHRDEDPDSEYSAVFYLKDKFNLIDGGTMWLSDTPDVKYTKYEESACTRIASWATLENKETGEVYTHINTHLDHVSDTSRTLQAKVLKEKISGFTNTFVCTGDFNTFESSEVYSTMLEIADDTRKVAVNTDEGTTFHDYGKITDEYETAIDYIFVPRDTKVDTYKIIRNTVMDMYPSDHYPIVADIIF